MNFKEILEHVSSGKVQDDSVSSTRLFDRTKIMPLLAQLGLPPEDIGTARNFELFNDVKKRIPDSINVFESLASALDEQDRLSEKLSKLESEQSKLGFFGKIGQFFTRTFNYSNSIEGKIKTTEEEITKSQSAIQKVEEELLRQLSNYYKQRFDYYSQDISKYQAELDNYTAQGNSNKAADARAKLESYQEKLSSLNKLFSNYAELGENGEIKKFVHPEFLLERIKDKDKREFLTSPHTELAGVLTYAGVKNADTLVGFASLLKSNLRVQAVIEGLEVFEKAMEKGLDSVTLRSLSEILSKTARLNQKSIENMKISEYPHDNVMHFVAGFIDYLVDMESNFGKENSPISILQEHIQDLKDLAKVNRTSLKNFAAMNSEQLRNSPVGSNVEQILTSPELNGDNVYAELGDALNKLSEVVTNLASTIIIHTLDHLQTPPEHTYDFSKAKNLAEILDMIKGEKTSHARISKTMEFATQLFGDSNKLEEKVLAKVKELKENREKKAEQKVHVQAPIQGDVDSATVQPVVEKPATDAVIASNTPQHEMAQ